MASNAPPASAQRIIRLALLSGILIFGAVVYFMRTTGAVSSPGSPDEYAPLELIALGMVFVAAFGVFFLRRLVEQTGDGARKFQLSLVAFALCEGAALLGGVYWLLSGAFLPYVAGVGVFMLALAWIPGPSE